MLDVFSRKIVAAEVHAEESANIAAELVQWACEREGVQRDFGDYGRWYLGIDREARHDIKAKFELPYGDSEKVHRCGVLSAESRAGEYGRRDIEAAAHELHEMIDERRRGRPAHP